MCGNRDGSNGAICMIAGSNTCICKCPLAIGLHMQNIWQ